MQGATIEDSDDQAIVCVRPDGEPIVADTITLIPRDGGAFWVGGKK